MTKIVIITGSDEKAEEIGMALLVEAQNKNGYIRGDTHKPSSEQLERYMKNGISTSADIITEATKRFRNGDDYGLSVWKVPEGIEIIYIDADKETE